MAADFWQLVNGWELVDWSLNVDSGAPVVAAPGGGLKPRNVNDSLSFSVKTPFLDDDEAIAISLLVLV